MGLPADPQILTGTCTRWSGSGLVDWSREVLDDFCNCSAYVDWDISCKLMICIGE
jgi:hypothetical protein